MTTRTVAFTVGDGAAAGHIPLDFDVHATFGQARPPVVVTVNAHSWRSTVAVMRGETFVPFRASHRAAAGAAPGDRVEAILTLDTEARTVDLPDDLAAALAAAGARAGWDRLSYSHQREYVEAIASAKRPETRTKRLAAGVAAAQARGG